MKNIVMNRLFLSSVFILLISSFLFTACNNNEIGNGKDVNPESIYFDYKIWGEEGNDNITVMLQYRFAGRSGTTLLLEDPSRVELDGEQLKVDSSAMTGAYYEIIKPVNAFTGQHTITYIDNTGKKLTEQFSFSPISLRTTFPNELKRNDLVFELNGLDSVDFVRVLMLDTAFESKDINGIDTVRNGKLVISKERLQNVNNGPIHLELYKEMDRPIKDGTKEGGRLSITYGLKRDFILTD